MLMASPSLSLSMSLCPSDYCSGKNPVSQLHEWCQRARLPLECSATSSGPPHDPKWGAQWLVAGQPMPPEPVVERTKTAARELAARFALDALLLASMPPVMAPPTRPREPPLPSPLDAALLLLVFLNPVRWYTYST